jgi:hypothetical protein
MISFAAACLRLHLRALNNCGDGSVREVEAVPCEDGESVMIYAVDAAGNTLAVCFVPDEAVDLSFYVEAFDHSGGGASEVQKV